MGGVLMGSVRIGFMGEEDRLCSKGEQVEIW